MREATLDVLDGALECDGVWGEQEMDVVWHYDEGVQREMCSVVLKAADK